MRSGFSSHSDSGRSSSPTTSLRMTTPRVCGPKSSPTNGVESRSGASVSRCSENTW